MAVITGKKTIFFVTSPRSPNKLADEIRFLVENFSGRPWNTETQKEYYMGLSKQKFFVGTATGDIAFKARDRINRAPKSLGLVVLKPVIALTDAGKKYVYGKRPEEIFLRQLLKFQFPSSYHVDKDGFFDIKPYLELMRLIHDLGSLSKNEIALFVIQLTNFSKYQEIKNKIEIFRDGVKGLRDKKISYKKFVFDAFISELKMLFKHEILEDDLSTRESEDVSIDKFIATKKRNYMDYADAAIRYLRATGLFTINPRTFKIYTIPDKEKDLEYILENTDRKTVNFSIADEYEKYLSAPTTPLLISDDKQELIKKIMNREPATEFDSIDAMNIDQLKDVYYGIVAEDLSILVEKEKKKLKSYQEYDDIISTFNEIEKKEIADPPLFLEWNVWRSFAMLDDGDISGNFKIDDDGIPLYTAPGNTPDIVCRYKDFETIVEVTMSSGHKQYEMEGEPIARHYGDHKITTNKDVYCIFIAPQLSGAAVAHYFVLYRTNIEKYGGRAKIIPISLGDFKKLLNNANNSKVKPTADDLKKLWSELAALALTSDSEVEWCRKISTKVETVFR